MSEKRPQAREHRVFARCNPCRGRVDHSELILDMVVTDAEEQVRRRRERKAEDNDAA